MKWIVLFLCVIFLSCQSIPSSQPPQLLDWPQPPNPEGEVFLLSEDIMVPAGIVVMSFDYWQRLAAYIIAIEDLRLQTLQMKTAFK